MRNSSKVSNQGHLRTAKFLTYHPQGFTKILPRDRGFRQIVTYRGDFAAPQFPVIGMNWSHF